MFNRQKLFLLITLLLFGCANFDNAAIDTFKDAFHLNHKELTPNFNPKFNYLAVHASSGLIFMVTTPPSHVTDLVTWYSAQRDSLTLNQGRLANIYGTLTEWREVNLKEAPNWQRLLSSEQPITWHRVRNQLPGYLFNVHETLNIFKTIPPSVIKLNYHQANTLTWFQENNLTHPELGPSFYALSQHKHQYQVVFSQFCLAPNDCLTLEQVPNNKSGQE